MKIFELFDRNVPVTWSHRETGFWSGDFHVGGERYRIRADHENHEGYANAWDFVFYAHAVEDDGYEGWTVDDTAKAGHNAKIVLATVIRALSELIQKEAPDLIEFTAAKGAKKGDLDKALGQGRASVYDFISKRFSQTLAAQGYRCERELGINLDTFTITKIVPGT